MKKPINCGRSGLYYLIGNRLENIFKATKKTAKKYDNMGITKGQ